MYIYIQYIYISIYLSLSPLANHGEWLLIIVTWLTMVNNGSHWLMASNGMFNGNSLVIKHGWEIPKRWTCLLKESWNQMGDFPARPVWLPKVGHSTSPLNKMGPCKLPQRRAGFMIVSPTMMNNKKVVV